MRTYSNFLLFEDVLTNLPTASTLITSAASTLLNPSITIVSEDCGTFLGNVVPVDYSAVGLVESATKAPLTVSRITQLMSQGITTIRVRTLYSCISKKGVCATCYESSVRQIPRLLDGSWYLDGTISLSGIGLLPVGSVVSIPNEFIYKSDIIIGNGISATYTLTQDPSQYTRTSFEPLINTEVQSIVGTTITFNSVRLPSDIFVLHYYTISSDPFLEYMAKSYSGALLGIAPLPSYQLKLKPSLYQGMFSDNQVSLLKNELTPYSTSIPPTFLEYCDTINDPLEKVLFIIYLYAIYGNVS